MPFDYHILLASHYLLAAYTLLILSFLSCYVFKSLFSRGVFLFLALLFGLYALSISWVGLIFIIMYGFVFYVMLLNKSKYKRGIALVVFFAMSFLLMSHYMPWMGIQPWSILSDEQLSAGSAPYSMAFSFDKSLIGLFFIWFSLDSVANEGRWKNVLKIGFLSGCFSIIILIPLAYYMHYIRFSPNMTSFFFLWAIHNLFFVCFAEEALFRGVIQKTIVLHMQRFRGGKWLGLIIAALIFGFAHYRGEIKEIIMPSVAGLLYGYTFLKAQKIEASIITHFMVNVVHFLVFTYPGVINFIC